MHLKQMWLFSEGQKKKNSIWSNRKMWNKFFHNIFDVMGPNMTKKYNLVKVRRSPTLPEKQQYNTIIFFPLHD